MSNAQSLTEYFVRLPDGAIVAGGFRTATEAALWGLGRALIIGHSFEVHSEQRRHVSVDFTRRRGATRAERAGLR